MIITIAGHASIRHEVRHIDVERDHEQEHDPISPNTSFDDM
jgi:hypothetical protein